MPVHLDITALNDVRKFRSVQNLILGANVITHGLGLVTPFATVVELRDNVTGADISARVTLESANTLTITTVAALTAVRITILG